MQKLADRLTPALIALIAIGFIAKAMLFKPISAMAPILIGITVLILALIELATRLDGAPGRVLNRLFTPAQGADHAPAAMDARRQAIAVGAVVGLVAAMVLVGLIPSSALFVMLAIRFGAGLSWRASIASGLAMGLVIWLIFGGLLSLDIPMGLLFDGET